MLREVKTGPIYSVMTLFTIIAMIACFFLGEEPVKAARFTAGAKAVLSEEGRGHFPQEPGESAVPAPADNPDLKADFSRNFVLLPANNADSAFYFAKLRLGTKAGPLDNKNTILLKLRI